MKNKKFDLEGDKFLLACSTSCVLNSPLVDFLDREGNPNRVSYCPILKLNLETLLPQQVDRRLYSRLKYENFVTYKGFSSLPKNN